MKKLAFVFPGQGSQSAGMMQDFVEHYPRASKLLTLASDTLGCDFKAMMLHGSAEELNLTTNTQPAMLIADVIVWSYWCDHSDVRPTMVAGHSLGEYAALVAAEALSFEAALKLVARRAQLMQDAAPEGVGALAAIIGLSAEAVEEVCLQASNETEVVTPANFNSPGQIVISGHAAVVARAMSLAKIAGAKLAKKLPVSVPSHSALMKPAAVLFEQDVENVELKMPVIPLINNVDVAVETNVQAIKSALVRQLYSPVRWVETIEAMVKAGVEVIDECGSGKVLTGMNKRIDRSVVYRPMGSVEAIQAIIKES